MKKKFVFYIFLFVFFIIPFNSLISADETPPEPPPITCWDCSSSWVVYYCVGDCGGQIWGIKHTIPCYSCSDGSGGGGAEVVSPPFLVETCSPYKACEGGSSPVCVCKGRCYPAPTLNSLSSVSKNVFDSFGKVKLPVKLDWQDLNVSPCTVEHYEYQVNGAGGTDGRTPGSESEVEVRDCRLKSKTSYGWQVRACFDDCSPWGGPQSFNTSEAPELKTPYDSDWEGSNLANSEIPLTFTWCSIDDNPEMYVMWADINGIKAPFSPLPINKNGSGVLQASLSDDLFFSKTNNYAWKIAACYSEDWEGVCEQIEPDSSSYSQTWSVKPTGTLPAPVLLSPANDPLGANAVGLPLTIDWDGQNMIQSYAYQLTSIDSPIIEGSSSQSQDTLGTDILSLDTLYSWKVKPCWDYSGANCETQWSEEWKFRTTGAPPTGLSATPNVEGGVLMPTKLDWNDVSGAKSYYYEVATDPAFANIVIAETDKVVPLSEVEINYPQILMDNTYWWRVKTCADFNGEICGIASAPESFTTLRISPPTSLSPGTDDPSSPAEVVWNQLELSWNKIDGAQSYWYEIQSSVDGKTTNIKNSVSIDPINDVGKSLQWRVRACVDTVSTKIDDPKVCSDWSQWKQIKTIEPQGVAKTGILPCGRSVDNLKTTDYNEREQCQFKHFFLLIKNILNFILWKLTPIMLVIELIITGVISYFSGFMRDQNTLALIKSIWKWTGIGVGVIFFAWIFMVLLLALLGFQVSIFGNWWQIKF
jgi:hypothetical protein